MRWRPIPSFWAASSRCNIAQATCCFLPTAVSSAIQDALSSSNNMLSSAASAATSAGRFRTNIFTASTLIIGSRNPAKRGSPLRKAARKSAEARPRLQARANPLRALRPIFHFRHARRQRRQIAVNLARSASEGFPQVHLQVAAVRNRLQSFFHAGTSKS